MLVIKFYRVFNRDNMTIPLHIDNIDHGCKGCTFAAAGRAGNQNHAARPVKQIFDIIGQPDLFKRQQLAWNLAENRSEIAFLLEGAYAETGFISEAETEVNRTYLLNLLHLTFRCN